MVSSSIFAFSLIMFMGIVTPGPTVLLALNNAARYGIKHALYGIAGAVIADVVLVGLVGFGLGMVLAASETVFVSLKWAGAAWLAYLGFCMLRSTGGGSGEDAIETLPARSALFVKSFLVAVSNPKYYLFLTALLPQFVNPAMPAVPQYSVLAAIIVGIDIAVMIAYAILGRKSVSLWKANGVKWMNRVSGAFLILLAASVAISK
ncbi:LysE family translocator [Chromobacterium piscinae]|uniref:LysE family translocator n=1 Tax=Chromobacterium piscinae TaxID=686831 RepID=UPI001E424BF9|nr:LysE family translocator [Chromobacterium piscinae]MCD4506107.1 LysE family translocator [Chromobacterium piscinae]